MAIDLNYQRIETAVSKAGLSMGEAAKLFHVSRQTLYNWKNGKRTNNAFILNTIQRLVELLEAATAAGKLPLGKDIPLNQRMTAVNRILVSCRTSH